MNLNLKRGGARHWHGNRKWVTLRHWGDVHAGGESCARAGEGVTLEQLYSEKIGIYSNCKKGSHQPLKL